MIIELSKFVVQLFAPCFINMKNGLNILHHYFVAVSDKPCNFDLILRPSMSIPLNAEFKGSNE